MIKIKRDSIAFRNIFHRLKIIFFLKITREELYTREYSLLIKINKRSQKVDLVSHLKEQQIKNKFQYFRVRVTNILSRQLLRKD
jgi:hypothetical protein